ncbi:MULTISPECIES: GNAT family N-acetyltransferase [Sphingomonas]|uniref:GNAT family N-acetyltransferase n=1 Tax=Sphingomonas adhaesiva TaxID=28212 RepID=A0A2A4IBY9_9SPHN|nr:MULTISPECIES: GNAT family N-acetyltransferase [Sphingomonas]PCG16049.1 GNAT family N-acetyltransferase [Sphingomonas adhaesiva]
MSGAFEAYWDRAMGGDHAGVAVDPQARRAMLLTETSGRTRAVMPPAIAAAIGWSDGAGSIAEWRRRLAAAGMALNDPDALFRWGGGEATDPRARRLDAEDAAAFARFYAAASEQDRDDAWVEWDHDAVFGAVVDGELLCAASLYRWAGTPIADLGVLTLPQARGRGLARAVVRAIAVHARAQGWEPQYRCQTDNAASLALARSSGFVRFGTWEVAVDD